MHFGIIIWSARVMGDIEDGVFCPFRSSTTRELPVVGGGSNPFRWVLLLLVHCARRRLFFPYALHSQTKQSNPGTNEDRGGRGSECLAISRIWVRCYSRHLPSGTALFRPPPYHRILFAIHDSWIPPRTLRPEESTERHGRVRAPVNKRMA